MGNNIREDNVLNLKEVKFSSKRIKSIVINEVRYVNANFDGCIGTTGRNIIMQDKNNRVEEC